MADFNIRSIKFKNANTLDFTNVNNLEIISLDTSTSNFAKIPINDIITNKIKADVGAIFEYNSLDKYFHIGKDYTDAELYSLNAIADGVIAASRDWTSGGCTEASCSSSCIALATHASCANSCSGGCNTTSTGKAVCTLSSCSGSCMSSNAAIANY